ncbi:MAG: type I 3-dehydroquinate dehydratase [Candidatus Aenigmatarchaeota archaeon]
MRVCAVLTGRSMAGLREQAYEAKQQGANLVEIRIDRIDDPENIETIESFPLPVIVSCVCTKDPDVLNLVKKAMKFKTEFIDLDLGFPKKSLEEIFSYARSNGISTIVSYYPERFVSPKILKKVVDDMAVLSKYVKLKLPVKSRKDVDFREIYDASSKVGAKISLLNTLENSYATALERKNFLGYGKLAGDQENKHLTEIGTIKNRIIGDA